SAVLDGDIPRPSTAHGDVPTRLDDVVMRALERDMTARWASAGDMLAALQRYLYSLDEMPGPRDVAALVARYCPPETRRLPTHHDPDVELPPEITQPRARPATDAEAPRPGPMTAVIPRDGVTPRGKRHSRARTDTSATPAPLEQLLERAASPTFARDRDDRAPAPPSDDAAARNDPPAINLPGRTAPSGSALRIAGFGALALAVGAVYVF